MCLAGPNSDQWARNVCFGICSIKLRSQIKNIDHNKSVTITNIETKEIYLNKGLSAAIFSLLKSNRLFVSQLLYLNLYLFLSVVPLVINSFIKDKYNND